MIELIFFILTRGCEIRYVWDKLLCKRTAGMCPMWFEDRLALSDTEAEKASSVLAHLV